MVKKKQIKTSKPKKLKQSKQIKTENLKAGLSDKVPKTKIKVVGIGGGGGSIISELAGSLKEIEFIAVNTDKQALKALPKKVKSFQFGGHLTKGLGTGMNPKLGQEAAQEAREDIKGIFSGVDLAVLVASLGGGTGSGAGPVFAEISKEVSRVTLGIFTLPFEFEGEKRAKIASAALDKLKQNINALAVVSNEKVFEIIDKDTPFQSAFSFVNKILAKGLEGLIETIYRPGLINIDFADLKTVLAPNIFSSKSQGMLAYLNCAEAGGDSRVIEATKKVLNNPLQNYDIQGAERILFNIAGDKNLKMSEVEEIARTIGGFSEGARVIFGISQTVKLKNKIRITLLATSSGELQAIKKQKAKTKVKAKGALKNLLAGKKTKQFSKMEKSPAPSSDKIDNKKEQIEKHSKESINKPTAVPGKEQTHLLPNREQDSVFQEEQDEAKETFPARRNGLQLKRETEQLEREIVKKEEEWEAPAFLRRKK